MYCLILIFLQVPPGLFDEQGESINKGAIYISENSPQEVSKAYFEQFKEDFSLFLRLRSEEVTSGGRMVLILVGREGPNHVDRGNSFLWEILYRSFALLVSEVCILVIVICSLIINDNNDIIFNSLKFVLTTPYVISFLKLKKKKRKENHLVLLVIYNLLVWA